MGEMLAQLSEELAQSVATAGAAVVRVEGRRRIPGSGIVWNSEGIIATANHVARRDAGIRIGLADGSTIAARVAGRDPSTDLAVLRVETNGLEAAQQADELAVGHLALALGRPGRTVQATLGIVSALGDGPWRTPAGGQVDRYLQSDVVMYPGFSGGPLVDVAGRVLGLNTSALVRGVSVAVPAANVANVVDTLLAHGRIRRGYLGVNTQLARLPRPAQERLNQESGLLIVGVEPGSPASAGGLVLGDTIVGLDGSRVRQHDDLLALLTGDRVGSKVPVQILRGGVDTTVAVTIGER